MKKYKSFILMAILSICCFMGVREVKAADAPLTFKNYQMICSPESIEAGGKSTCYLFAMHNGGNLKLNGFVSVIYTNDNLLIEGVRAEASRVAYAKLVPSGKKATEVGVQNNKWVVGDDAHQPYQCNLSWYDLAGTRLHGAGASGSQVITDTNKNDSSCAIYYSGSDSPVFDLGTLRTAGSHTEVFKDSTNRDQYAILGVYEVKLDPEMKAGANRCGDICVRVWTVPDGVYYSDAQKCGTNQEGCGQTTTTEQYCTEIHIKASGETETGAFASYTILAAAAFIAISAVAIAKKNNKLYKI